MLSFWFFCFHPYNKSLCFFHFGSLQMFGFLVFDFFSLSWSSKVPSQKFVFAIWALLFILICITFSARYGLLLFWIFLSSFYSCPLWFLGFVGMMSLNCFFILKGWVIDASNGSSPNTLLSKVPILACQMAFIMWYPSVFQIIWKKHYTVHLPVPGARLSTAVAQMSAQIPSPALPCSSGSVQVSQQRDLSVR